MTEEQRRNLERLADRAVTWPARPLTAKDRDDIRAALSEIAEPSGGRIEAMKAHLSRLEAENERLDRECSEATRGLASEARRSMRLEAAIRELTEHVLDLRRQLTPVDPGEREFLGRLVRDAWVAWAREHPEPKSSWLIPYEELPEADREADRRIGDAMAVWFGSFIDQAEKRADRAMRGLEAKLATPVDPDAPRRFRYRSRVSGWLYGVYFPRWDRTAFGNGPRMKGLPDQDGLEWLDDPSPAPAEGATATGAAPAESAPPARSEDA
jgi:hypothetical protein